MRVSCMTENKAIKRFRALVSVTGSVEFAPSSSSRMELDTQNESDKLIID